MLTLRTECLKSLYFLNMNQREDLVTGAATDTCTWLLDNENYTTWVAQPHALLWIVGNPGAGKSTLLRYALQEASRSTDVVASFFFFGRGSDLQKSSCGLFRSLLHQLLKQIPEMLSDFITIYETKLDDKQKSESECEWSEAELQNFLDKWILSAARDRPIQIYVDALDEGGENVAVKLVEYFVKLIKQLSPTHAGFKICFSCRHYPVLASKDALKICVEDENRQDIATYVQQKLMKHPFSNPGEAPKLKQEIIEKASGVFQWVVLIIAIIIKSDNDGASVKQLRKKLQEIPGDLSDLYNHILSKIEDRKRAVQLMQWVCFAERALSLEELRFAMVVDVTNDFASLKECQNSEGFVETDEQMKRTVTSLSGGLAETVEYQNGQTVRFIHQSVNDYLIERGLQELDTSFFHDVNHYLSQSGLPSLDNSLSDNVVGLAHFRMSRSCIKYMALEEILSSHEPTHWNSLTYNHQSIHSYNFDERKKMENDFPFLRYSQYWASHTQSMEKQRIPQNDLLHLFRWPPEEFVESWAKCLYYHGKIFTYGTTLLGVAAEYGLVSVIEAMLISRENFDFNSENRFGQTPLYLAASNGHKAVVELLIARDDIEINTKDNKDQTPLHLAALRGAEAVVELLVARDDLEINTKNNWGRTPLHLAASNGHKAVVGLLIARDDVEINMNNNRGRTPLHLAVCWKRRAVVRLLIARDDIGINTKDNLGRTPLHLAALRGAEAVVRLLIARDDIEINTKDNKGQTSLHFAAWHGAKAVVGLLIDRDDVEIDTKDNEGRTPLGVAATMGRKAVVELLEREISRRRNRLQG